MIGSLFKKRESVYNPSALPSSSSSSTTVPTPSLPCSPAAYNNSNAGNLQTGCDPSPLSASSSSSLNLLFSNSHVNNNQRPTEIPGLSKSTDNRAGYSNGTSNGTSSKINPQETDKLSDQSGLNISSLYGINVTPPTPAFKLSDKRSGFRMVVIQDAGIRKKQPLFDSAVPYNKNFTIMQQKLNKKLHHSINELSLFMFGCYGMPMSENNMTTKMHYLPSLSSMHSSVLLTRLFSLDSSFRLKPHKLSANSLDWEPHPLLETDELPLYENSSIRFSIGLVIPVSSSIESVRDEITENWLQTSDTLLTLQNLIVEKLKNNYKSQNSSKKAQSHFGQSNPTYCSPNNNIHSLSNKSTNFGFPIYSLQTEMEIYQTLGSLLSRLISLLEVPRLFIDLKHSNQSLIDWASTLSLWLELKDGRSHHSLDIQSNGNTDCLDNNLYLPINSTHSIKFLASLLSIFLPLRNSLFSDPLTEHTGLTKLRIIIGTGNPVISQKLVFILVGILGYEKFSDLYEKAKKLPKQSRVEKSNEPIAVPIPISRPEGDYSSSNVLTKNNSLIIDGPPQPMDINFKSSPLRMQHSPSISTISASVQTQRIPVPMLTRTSSYASLQNFSTSYGANVPNSYGSQTSSNSWRNNFGSFMDRWKNSIMSSPTTSQLSKSPQTEFPSPNLSEYEEYPWYSHKKSNPLLSPAPSFTSGNTTTTQNASVRRISMKTLNAGNYVSNDDYKLSRSTINLIPSSFINIVDNINVEINAIMRAEFECSVSDSGNDSVMDISMKKSKLLKDEKPISSVTAIPLPPLVGYISQFRPEFNMMSCPNRILQDGVFVETMKDDMKKVQVIESDVFFVNLAMRKVTLLEMKNKSAKSSTDKNENFQLYTSKSMLIDKKHSGPESADSSFKSKGSKKSHLSETLESSFVLNDTVIFTPEKPLRNDQKIGTSSTNTISEKVDLYDQLLEKIAYTVNNFFLDLKDSSRDTSTIEKENECCDNIRQLIEQLMSISDST